jgi:hypothetical protein
MGYLVGIIAILGIFSYLYIKPTFSKWHTINQLVWKIKSPAAES